MKCPTTPLQSRRKDELLSIEEANDAVVIDNDNRVSVLFDDGAEACLALGKRGLEAVDLDLKIGWPAYCVLTVAAFNRISDSDLRIPARRQASVIPILWT